MFRYFYCNFVALMESKATYVKCCIWQVSCYMLTILLLLIPITQMLHSHEDDVNPTTASSKSITKTQYCSVCDYLTHIKSKEVRLDFAPSIITPTLSSTTLRYLVDAMVGKYSLVKSTNKAPPQLRLTFVQA